MIKHGSTIAYRNVTQYYTKLDMALQKGFIFYKPSTFSLGVSGLASSFCSGVGERRLGLGDLCGVGLRFLLCRSFGLVPNGGGVGSGWDPKFLDIPTSNKYITVLAIYITEVRWLFSSAHLMSSVKL